VTESTAGPTDHAGLAVLSFAKCLQLAGSQPVGRVAFLPPATRLTTWSPSAPRSEWVVIRPDEVTGRRL
jgi:hypothetical protein